MRYKSFIVAVTISISQTLTGMPAGAAAQDPYAEPEENAPSVNNLLSPGQVKMLVGVLSIAGIYFITKGGMVLPASLFVRGILNTVTVAMVLVTFDGVVHTFVGPDWSPLRKFVTYLYTYYKRWSSGPGPESGLKAPQELIQ